MREFKITPNKHKQEVAALPKLLFTPETKPEKPVKRAYNRKKPVIVEKTVEIPNNMRFHNRKKTNSNLKKSVAGIAPKERH